MRLLPYNFDVEDLVLGVMYGRSAALGGIGGGRCVRERCMCSGCPVGKVACIVISSLTYLSHDRSPASKLRRRLLRCEKGGACI